MTLCPGCSKREQRGNGMCASCRTHSPSFQYRHGCRCPLCKKYKAETQAKRRARIKATA